MTALAVSPAISVVIPTEGLRPDSLARGLLGLSGQRHPDFEVIVAGPEGCLAGAGALGAHARHVPVAPGNVSAARNAGIAAAAGGIVAFMDDDAVPEPGWLGALLDGFLARDVAGVGGFTLGADGMRWQWRGTGTDALGRDHALEIDDFVPPAVPEAPEGVIPRPAGANCAFRRAALVAAGGFDEAFRFYLDETDLALRLAATGWRIALAPRAVVHHGMAASPRRGRGRVPRDLLEIGASQAAFLRRHAPDRLDEGLQAFRATQELRLVRLMTAGRLAAEQARVLLRGLEAGLAEGIARAPAPATLPPAPRAAFVPFPSGAASGRILLSSAGRPDAALRDRARAAAGAGAEVTLLGLAGALGRSRAGLGADGVWLHEIGGARATRPARLEAERDRIAQLRGPFVAP